MNYKHGMAGNGKLSEKQIQDCYKKYVTTNLDIADLAREHGITWQMMYGYFKRRGLKTIKKLHKSTKYQSKLNDNYFSEINNNTKAYLLGILYADGHIRKRKDKLFCGLGLQKQDSYILELFKSELECSYKVRIEKNQSKIEVQSQKLVEDLIKLGITYQKSRGTLNFPPIDFEYYNSFILGFFDGDGTISVNEVNKKIQIAMCCTYKPFLERIQEILNKNNIRTNIYISRRSLINSKHLDLYSLHILDMESKSNFIKYIYKNSNNYLIRKFNKTVNANTVLNTKRKRSVSV